jgi:hypothetical protein
LIGILPVVRRKPVESESDHIVLANLAGSGLRNLRGHGVEFSEFVWLETEGGGGEPLFLL